MTRGLAPRHRVHRGSAPRAGRLALVLALVAACVAAPTLAHARGCTETSRIVGQQRCSHFGDGWDATNVLRVSLALFGGARTFQRPAGELDGVLWTGSTPHPFAVQGNQFAPGTVALATVGARLAVFPFRWFYVSAEFEYGSGASTFTDRWSADGSLAVNPLRTQYLGVGSALGVAFPLGDVMLRAECLFGAHAASLVADVMYGENARVVAVGAWTGRVEPRASVLFWVHRNVSVGLTAGASVLPQVEFAASAFVEVHTRAYDGLFDR